MLANSSLVSFRISHDARADVNAHAFCPQLGPTPGKLGPTLLAPTVVRIIYTFRSAQWSVDVRQASDCNTVYAQTQRSEPTRYMNMHV